MTIHVGEETTAFATATRLPAVCGLTIVRFWPEASNGTTDVSMPGVLTADVALLVAVVPAGTDAFGERYADHAHAIRMPAITPSTAIVIYFVELEAGFGGGT